MSAPTDRRRNEVTDEGLVIALVAMALRHYWDYRVELSVVWTVYIAYACCARATNDGIASGLVLLSVGAVLTFGRTRRAVMARLGQARWRRRVVRVFRQFDGRLGARPPRVAGVRQVARGVVTVELTLRVGTAVGDIEQANERIAAALRVAVVRVERERNDASRVTLSIVLRDPFVGGSTGCPWVTTPEMSLWQPIPIGVAETGAPVLLNLVERNLLVGGEPNGGKSKVLQLITAAAALDPEVTLWLFDAKRVELGRWQPVAASFCGPDTSAATALLDSLRREMERRYELLEAGHRRKVDPAAGMGLHVVVVDELMLYLTDPDKKAAQSFANSLRDLVARGRAAGIIVVAATQKPSTDVVPSSLRDLIAYRFALRCATRDASDTILGSGWAAEGYSASDVDPAQRGVGFLLHEGGVPMRLRAYYLSDHELDCLVVQARSVRAR